MKKQVEKELGFKISEQQYQWSEERARKKLTNIISRFGDACGVRQKPEYLAELIYEDVMVDILSKATIFVATSMLDMEKEHSTNCQSALSDGKDHQSGLQDNPGRHLIDQPMRLVFQCLE